MIPIMRAMVDPRVRRVVTVCGAQMGKTEGFWNVIGWRLDDDPAPILYIGPTQKLVESMSSDRVMKMLQSVPTLWDKLAKGKKNKITEKFIAGNAAIARWEAEQLWRPLATVGVFEHRTCKCCGYSSIAYSHHLQLQEYRTKPDTRRYTRAEYDAKLPRLSRVLNVSVDFCHHCVDTVFNQAELEEFDAPLSAIDLQ